MRTFGKLVFALTFFAVSVWAVTSITADATYDNPTAEMMFGP